MFLAIGDDKSDVSKNFTLSWEALLSIADIKEKIWNEIVDYSNNLSSPERKEMMISFFNRDSNEILAPYYDKYLTLMKEFSNWPINEFFGEFWTFLVPNFGITDYFIDELKRIVVEFENDIKYESYCRNANKVIGKLENIKKVKDHALSK